LLGKKYHEAHGPAREIEDEVLARRGLTREDFLGCPGSRRPIRWPLQDATVEETADGLWLCFFLPKGAYATAVLREVMKADPEPDAKDDAPSEE
jgi:tRNA pseudouridine13 synthase